MPWKNQSVQPLPWAEYWSDCGPLHARDDLQSTRRSIEYPHSWGDEIGANLPARCLTRSQFMDRYFINYLCALYAEMRDKMGKSDMDPSCSVALAFPAWSPPPPAAVGWRTVKHVGCALFLRCHAVK